MELYRLKDTPLAAKVDLVYGDIVEREDLNGVVEATEFILVRERGGSYLIKLGSGYMDSPEYLYEYRKAKRIEIEGELDLELPIKELTDEI